MTDTRNQQQVLIAGGGPSGLAAALLFLERGWEDIVIIERQPDPFAFERGKAFNYQIDPRGQQLLKRLGINEMLEEYGLANTDNYGVFVLPDGSSKKFKSIFLDPDRGVCYWTKRHLLTQMLMAAIEKKDVDGRIRLLRGHSAKSIDVPGDGRPTVLVTTPNGDREVFKPNLLIGCDGINSAIRTSLHDLTDRTEFTTKKHPSSSSALQYKVLTFPPKFDVRADIKEADDHTLSYAFISRHKEDHLKFALFALPVASQTQDRSINIIRPKNNKIWEIDNGPDLLDHLEDSFPQLDIRSLISDREADEFAKQTAGRFPVPQYSERLYAGLGNGADNMHCILIGDAAHAFPPDLGLGVNSAFEDLFILENYLDQHPSDMGTALSAYETYRLPENAALVRLVQKVYPDQYNHKPLRHKLWMLETIVRIYLQRLAPSLFDKPPCMLVANYKITYQEIERRKRRQDRFTRAIVPGLLAALIGGVAVAAS